IARPRWLAGAVLTEYYPVREQWFNGRSGSASLRQTGSRGRSRGADPHRDYAATGEARSAAGNPIGEGPGSSRPLLQRRPLSGRLIADSRRASLALAPVRSPRRAIARLVS